MRLVDLDANQHYTLDGKYNVTPLEGLVEVTRCGECVHGILRGDFCICALFEIVLKRDDFCSRGHI